MNSGQREERVRAVLSAARRLADPLDPLGREARRVLPEATGLSEAGVVLGLSRHMECEVSDGDLSRLVARAGTAPRAHVVLSANVFVGAVRAIALAVAAAPVVRVRASRRESVMAPLVCRALGEIDPGLGVEMVDAIEAQPGDEVHVYGRRETIDAVRASVPDDAVVRGHGPGFGVAVVDGKRDDPKEAASLLSWDVVAFDQRGCLSPRIAFVQGDRHSALAFAAALATELEAREREVPRGPLSEEELRGQSLYRLTLQTVGVCHRGETFTVGVDVQAKALTLPPTGRHLHVVQVSDDEVLNQLIGPFSGAITCVGAGTCSGEASSMSARIDPEFVRGARFSFLGRMQSPPLDGPVDLRGVV